jgi:hypothetical protein
LYASQNPDPKESNLPVFKYRNGIKLLLAGMKSIIMVTSFFPEISSPITDHFAESQFAIFAADSAVKVRVAPALFIAIGIVSQIGIISRFLACSAVFAMRIGAAKAAQRRSLFSAETLNGSRAIRTDDGVETASILLFLEKKHAG